MAELRFMMIMLQGRIAHARRSEGGASVLEWALIAAVVVVAASTIGVIVTRVVNERGADLERCSNATVAC